MPTKNPAQTPTQKELSEKELDAALKICRSNDVRGLVLDLRFNPGGTLQSAEAVADRFLPRDQVIVHTRGHRVKPDVAKARKPRLDVQRDDLLVFHDQYLGTRHHSSSLSPRRRT